MAKHGSSFGCVVNSTNEQYRAKQGFSYHAGISAKTAEARGICMHLLTIPSGIMNS
jgi:uncharacterized RmlC-like cupin family protein